MFALHWCIPLCNRYQFVYNAAWYDLHDGFSQILSQLLEENKALFNTQRALHIELIFVMVSKFEFCAMQAMPLMLLMSMLITTTLHTCATQQLFRVGRCCPATCNTCVCCAVLQVIGGVSFLLMMVRPFLRHISKESRRCAELLVQLPPDFDVEGMVAATWGVVKHVSNAEAYTEFITAYQSGQYHCHAWMLLQYMHSLDSCNCCVPLSTALQACAHGASLAKWLLGTA